LESTAPALEFLNRELGERIPFFKQKISRKPAESRKVEIDWSEANIRSLRGSIGGAAKRSKPEALPKIPPSERREIHRAHQRGKMRAVASQAMLPRRL
jgi:hypothetical protein